MNFPADINVVFFLGISVILAFYIGQSVRLIRLPMILGYMLTGIVLGPSMLGLIDQEGLEYLSFIIDVGLGIVAFSIGTELDFSSLKRLGFGIVTVIFAESFGAFLLVFFFVYLFSQDLVLAILLGAIAPASAPAGTVAVIKEYKAKGPMTKALYAVVGFDDALGIIIFGFALAFAKALLLSRGAGDGAVMTFDLWLPLTEIAVSIAVGAAAGWLFTRMAEKPGENGMMLVLVFGTVLLLTGVALQFHGSLILTNMMAGIILTNFSHESVIQRVRSAIDSVLPLVFVLFFLVAGLHVDIGLLPSIGLLGIVYIAGRSVGLMGGAYLGSVMGAMEKKIRHYLGFGILSQAGLAIGLGFMAKNELAKFAAEYQLADVAAIGTGILLTISTTSIFFELVGPVATKFALEKAGEIESAETTKESL
jgi:Kef-type K+ transport system membrane component KefB